MRPVNVNVNARGIVHRQSRVRVRGFSPLLMAHLTNHDTDTKSVDVIGFPPFATRWDSCVNAKSPSLCAADDGDTDVHT